LPRSFLSRTLFTAKLSASDPLRIIHMMLNILVDLESRWMDRARPGLDRTTRPSGYIEASENHPQGVEHSQIEYLTYHGSCGRGHSPVQPPSFSEFGLR
jgi:hypothetical protein